MTYFERYGKANTEDTVQAVLTRAEELGIKHVVVASNTGATAEMFAGKGLEVVCVTHHVGFTGPGEDELGSEARQRLGEKGIKILTTTHLLAGIGRALRSKFGGVYPAEIVASTLRMFGQGLKVCVEISGMALDAGLIPYGEEIIAVGGTGRGADTAAVIVPAHSNQFFNTKIKEIICMPREK
ncbi:MAG: pyruvate kinase alpha/beta domain-containing protein [Bacillota bacterium]|nr:pyruvate kinase alpha/beta domain-containing protein [Bacillota bacterium]